MRKTLLGLCLLMLAACAQEPIMWYKDGADQSDFDQARAVCIFESKKFPPATYGVGVDKQVFIACMEAQGFHQ